MKDKALPAAEQSTVVIQLSLCQQTAIEATVADIGRLQQKLAALKDEAGLKPDTKYQITPDGRAVPQ